MAFSAPSTSVSDERMNILVIPSTLPHNLNDISGIFILDYLKCVEQFCRISVLDMRLVGSPHLKIDDRPFGKVYRLAATARRGGRVRKLFFYALLFLRGIKMNKYFQSCQLIHLHGCRPYGTLAILLARMLRIPVIITEHTGPFSKLVGNKFSMWFTRFCLERATAVLTVSHDLEAQMQASGISPKRVYVTHNPVDTDLFSCAGRGELDPMRNIVFIGRLEPYKGGLRTLRAFQKICERHPDWTLTIVGDGPELGLIKALLAQDLQLANRVRLTGQLRKMEIAREFRRASFLVFPSEHETFGLVIAEAMAAGLPVIVGNETAPKEFVDAECGLLVPPLDIDAIAQAMEYLIQHLAEFDSSAIRRKVVQRFGFEVFGKRLYEIYREVC